MFAVVDCQSITEDRRDVQALFRAAVLPAALRLWHASCEVCSHGRRQSQAEVSVAERGYSPPQGHHGCQPPQVPFTGYQPNLVLQPCGLIKLYTNIHTVSIKHNMSVLLLHYYIRLTASFPEPPG